MKLIIGLGNPGDSYETTWHNLGFKAIDQFQVAHETDFSPFKNQTKFQAEIAEGSLNDEKIILAKPQTYMNKSGLAVLAIAHFYKIKPEDIWIIHDEIDLPLGNLKISRDVSSAGHRGIQSIIDQLGGQGFIRFRLGIRPAQQSSIPTEDYVLQKIDDLDTMQEMLTATVTALNNSLRDGVDQAMNQTN